MSAPAGELLLVGIAFTAVMTVFGFAVHVISGAAADLSYSVARGVADGIRRWVDAAIPERRPSPSPASPVDVSPVRASGPRFASRA